MKFEISNSKNHTCWFEEFFHYKYTIIYGIKYIFFENQEIQILLVGSIPYT